VQYKSNNFITNLPQNVLVKKIRKISQYSAKMWRKVCDLLSVPPCIYFDRSLVSTILHHTTPWNSFSQNYNQNVIN